ncbi:MAG: S8 family serine peptidase [Bacteroidota bacterium]
MIPLLLPAQDVYLVYLTDKAGSQYDPYETLDAKAIERRLREGLDLCDQSDWPVSPTYVRSVARSASHIRYELRWLNALSVEADPDQIAQIAQLPFVSKVEALGEMILSQQLGLDPEALLLKAKQKLIQQRQQMGLDLFVEAGLDGEGVRIAILDAGFTGVHESPGFEHLFDNGQIVAVRDFYSDDDKVYAHSAHGNSVLGCIAGKYGEKLIGAAPNAEFLFARTEHRILENAVEEDHWLAAMEWADQQGADIINSSLGYTNKRYRYEDMDGKTAPVSRSAGMAASKGILVVNSAGNEGSGKWRYIGAPADHPQVLSIGGTQTILPIHVSFGSYGPNALGQRKPNLSAPGVVSSTSPLSGLSMTSGTSFSAPLVTGFAACVKQKYPDWTLKELFAKLESYGHLYPYYDYAHGYGVPQASKVLEAKATGYENSPSFDVRRAENELTILLRPQAEKRSTKERIIYYHYEQPDRQRLAMYEYRVLRPEADGYKFPLPTPIDDPSRKGMIRVWLDDYLWEMEW